MTTLYLITFTYNFTSYPDEREDERILFKGSLKDSSKNGLVKFIAANAPDYRQSYSGSGLPFPNPEIAYENTPNKGTAKVVIPDVALAPPLG